MSKTKLVRIRPGARVKVMRKIDNAPRWKDVWVSDMDETVGQIGTLLYKDRGGCVVEFDAGRSWNYPRSVLRVTRK